MQGKTAFITGATGFLGGALALRLVQDGATVKALARRPNRDKYLRGVPGIEIVMGDITDASRMRELMQGCDIVFHVAAALNGKLDFQRRVNVEGTRNVAIAAASADVERLVHVSTIAVYGYPATDIITENTPQQPGNVPYNRSKSEAETELISVVTEHNLPYSMIRPGMIYGARSAMWTYNMFNLAKRKPTPWIGDGSGTTYPIHVDDVVDLTCVLATHPAAENQIFNCVSDPAPTWREFLGAYAALAGHDNWLPVPVFAMKVIAPLAEFFMQLRGEPQDIPALIDFATGDTSYSMAKAKMLLDWQPQVSLAEGIQRCEPYLREKGLLR